MKKLFAAVLAAALLLAPTALAADTSETNAVTPAVGTPEVNAASSILMEKESGTILYEANTHEKLEPASVTKVMTLLLVMEAIDSGRISQDDMVTMSAHAVSMGGSQVYLKENEQMSVQDLLKAVAVPPPMTARWRWRSTSRAARRALWP